MNEHFWWIQPISTIINELFVCMVFLWHCLWYKHLQYENNNILKYRSQLLSSYKLPSHTVYFGNKPDGNESHNRPALSSRSDEFQKMAAHIWHRQNAGIQRVLSWKTKIFDFFLTTDNIQYNSLSDEYNTSNINI